MTMRKQRRNIKVKKHQRSLQNGRTTNVRKHNRNIEDLRRLEQAQRRQQIREEFTLEANKKKRTDILNQLMNDYRKTNNPEKQAKILKEMKRINAGGEIIPKKTKMTN